MSAITPDEYRASISASIDPLTSLQIDCDIQARMEAKAFVASHSSALMTAARLRYLRDHDPFFADALTNMEFGIEGVPDPGRAVLVMSHPAALTDFDGERFWMHATDLKRVSVTSKGDPCHRCTAMGDAGETGWVFHVVTDKYVVEFALCASCIGRYESMADCIRLRSGDTYVEIYNE